MRLRIVTSTAAALCIAAGLASCKHEQMATTELDENAAANATSPATAPSATEQVANQGATTPSASSDGGTSYRHGICDARALRHNEACEPADASPRT